MSGFSTAVKLSIGQHPSFHHILPVTAITDMHQNRCDDSTTMHHREVCPSQATNAFSASTFFVVSFDNKCGQPPPRKCTPICGMLS